jgi:hypothetical protein
MSVHIPSKGFFAWIKHPDTDRALLTDITADPAIDPSINSLPQIRLPVEKSPQWQDLEGTPEFNVYLDGDEQPIDELTKPIDAKDAATTVLEGRGGVELLAREPAEFDQTSRHTAAEDLITTHTTYDVDIPTPDFDTITDEVQQNPDTQAEFQNVSTIGSDEPFTATAGGAFETTPSVGYVVGYDSPADEIGWATNTPSDAGIGTSTGTQSPNSLTSNNSDTSGTGWIFENDGDSRSFDIDIPYDLAANEWETQLRGGSFDGSSIETFRIEIKVDGTEVGAFVDGFTTSDFRWYADTGGFSLSAGTHTVSIDMIDPDDQDNIGGDQFIVDAFGVFDTNYSYNFDNTADSNYNLDGPEVHPDGETFAFDDATTVFTFPSGAATLTIDDTTGAQRVQLSNDEGSTWLPNDGSENNTTSVDVNFSSATPQIRMRVTLDRHEPNGAQNETPTQGYASQSIDAYELTADVQQESLLIDYSETQSLEDHLTQIAGSEFFWAYRIDDGTPTLTFIQPGARTGDDPDLIQATVEKDIETYHKFTVNGANKRVSDERFNGSTSFVQLNNEDIVPGSETVRDPTDGTNFDRGDDYEVNWQDGEIRITTDGALSSGTEYAIDYRYEVSGSYTDPNAPTGFRERDVDIPAVTSERNAEQIAYTLVEIDGFNEPRYSANITVPPGVVTFDAVEALPLDTLDLPDDAGALDVEEPPQVTPQGTTFRLGTRERLEDRLSDLRRLVQQVARRSG